MIFDVYVEGVDTFDRATGALQGNGRQASVKPKVEQSKSMKGTELRFSFEWPYDPGGRYEFEVSGIMRHGHELQVPPVKFEPYSEQFWDM